MQGGRDKSYISKSHIKYYKTLNSLRSKYWTREQINITILTLYSDILIQIQIDTFGNILKNSYMLGVFALPLKAKHSELF